MFLSPVNNQSLMKFVSKVTDSDLLPPSGPTIS